MSATGPPPGIPTTGGGGPPPGVSTGRGGYVDPNWPFPGGPNDAPVIIYGYTPSFALALLGVIIFFIFTVVHIWQLFRHRSWYFTTFAVGLAFEIVGYVARTLSAKNNPYNLIYFIIQYFFIVTAPVFLSAGVYTILSALIHRLGRAYSILAPKLILWIFITSDAIATVCQITGAALIGVKQKKREDPTGANNILLGGLAYQVFAIGIFIILSSAFIFRARREIAKNGLIKFVAAFGIATLFIYLRTVFRLAETAEGLGGDLSTKEVYFGVLEFAPVIIAALLLTIWHPGRCVGNTISGIGKDTEEVSA
ncbi:RTA1 like protein-domain-containing protein [Podospora aff. communis PSN243]|uniref:RTA1 like protein-domain-containing protein n=1 Tax=Podospora aff. communis PSN243 TaxID=3040156 RepID=A0AAV9G3B4_9PEZI|nr:RTA1 like protein-domain-containing protein [Podospora aff. communis PSN243]